MKVLILTFALALVGANAFAQQNLDARNIYLGATGATCLFSNANGPISTIGCQLTVSGDTTVNGNASITGTETVGGNVTLNGSLLTVAGNSNFSGFVGAPGFASQTTAWRVTAGGALDVRYLFTDELRAKIFTADRESVLAGSQRVTKSFSILDGGGNFICPVAGGARVMRVQDAPTYPNVAVFVDGDAVLLHVWTRTSVGGLTITDCAGTVAGYIDGNGVNMPNQMQQWTFTRFTGAGAGGMTGGTAIPDGELVQDFGVSGNGYVETSAIDGSGGANAPYTQVVTWTGSPAPAGGGLATRCRMGQLAGITTLNEYGLLCGGTATDSRWFVFSDQRASIKNMQFDLYDGATPAIRLDPTIPAMAMGTPTLPCGYGCGGDGLWIGKFGSTYTFRLGRSDGSNGIFWDPANGVTFRGNADGATNIDGGNITTGFISANRIAADSLSGDKITGGSILAGDINVAGFADNLMRNGTFEEPQGAAVGDPRGLSGWTSDLTTSSTPFTASCCGLTGPGTMLLDPGAGTPTSYSSVVSLAMPVAANAIYRIALNVYSSAASPAAIHVLVYWASGAFGGVRYVRNPSSSAVAPDVVGCSGCYTFLAVNYALAAGWTHLEWAWQAPAGSSVASLALYNLGGTSGGGYTQIHYDDVEFTRRIGTGHIEANSISTALIQADAVKAGNIEAGAITTVKMSANSINGDRIEAGTLNANKIVADSITANEIAAIQISSISADLGTMTAGTINGLTINGVTVNGSTINGSTINAGSGGTIVLNNSGLAIAAGNGGDSARIILGGQSVFLNNADARITFGGNIHVTGSGAWSTVDGLFEVNDDLYARDILDVNNTLTAHNALVVGTTGYFGGTVTMNSDLSVSNKIYVGNLSTYGGAVRAVYRWSSSNELAHWTGAFAARTNVTPWVPPADPYAILNVPIVTYTGAGFTVPELGFSMENFATVAPLAVALDAAGQPEGELRVNAVVAYLLQIIKDLNRRLTLLGGMP